MAEIVRIWPAWVKTLGAMKAESEANPDVAVQAMCGTCNTAFRVDLDALIWALGRNATLIGRQASCKKMRCNGRVVFQFQNTPSTPFQTLSEGMKI